MDLLSRYSAKTLVPTHIKYKGRLMLTGNLFHEYMFEVSLTMNTRVPCDMFSTFLCNMPLQLARTLFRGDPLDILCAQCIPFLASFLFQTTHV